MTLEELKAEIKEKDLLVGKTVIDLIPEEIPEGAGFGVSSTYWSLWYGEEEEQWYIAVEYSGVQGTYRMETVEKC